MKVTLAKTAGFCFGVDRAVSLVEQSVACGKHVATLGPIIHNKHVVNRFAAQGVKELHSPSEADAGSCVVIRSHGVSKAVYEELDNYFPQQQADEATLRSLCTKEALMETPFMLGPVSLSFHYEAKILYPSQPSLMRVTIPYNALRGHMTAYGEQQTDNSNYKMCALTFDDGPDYANTATLLNNLRHAGAQGTFFLVGDRIEEFADIALRENDENHSLQSHHFKHTDTSKSTIPRIQAYTEKMYNVMTKTWGLAPWMLRAPYGIFEYFIKSKLNLPFIEWDVDTKDWTGKSTAAVMSVVRNETKDGSIILMHDIKDKTPESGKQAAEWLYDHGFMCVNVEELFINYQQDMTPNKVFYSVKTTQE